MRAFIEVLDFVPEYSPVNVDGKVLYWRERIEDMHLPVQNKCSEGSLQLAVNKSPVLGL